MSTYNLSDEDLLFCPIVLENHTCLKKNVAKIKPCNLERSSAKIKEYIAKLEIPSNRVYLPDPKKEIDTDLNHYHGNLLYSNLKYHLRHTCALTEGELCYYLGLKAPDTFSAHYCAYEHPILLHRMACKLNRWTCELDEANIPLVPIFHQERIMCGTESMIFSGTGAELICTDLTITPQDPENLDEIILQICSNHGVSGSVISMKDMEITKNE